MSKPHMLLPVAVAFALLATSQNSLNAQIREEETVSNASAVLDEVMRTPGKKIPHALLAKAEAVVIIPNMIKAGFVLGARHGHGVCLIRNPKGGWDAPRFVQMTGGSVGFQAGVQSTDVVLLFMTKNSVQGLLSGKFTIGADAAAAAGPVGRQLAAATDERFRAEILSYARSRGLFAGVSLDGSALTLDPRAEAAYYRVEPNGEPAPLPEPAVALIEKVIQYSQANPEVDPVPATTVPQRVQPTGDIRSQKRAELAAAEARLAKILPKDWRAYLAFPTEVLIQENHPPIEQLRALLARFEKVAANPQYRTLSERGEFQQTLKSLRDYITVLSAAQGQPTLQLPPAPAN